MRELTGVGEQLQKGRRRGRAWAAIGLLCIGVLAWSARRPICIGAGHLLVAEDPPTPVDLIVVSSASTPGGALEAAQLYREGIGGEILLMTESAEPIDAALEQLGVPRMRDADVAQAVLARRGVPAGAIRVFPVPVDGTDTEITELSAFARQRSLGSVLFITARSHTRRARWLLRRRLPAHTRVTVRSALFDTFSPDTWWHRRGESREVAMEYLRWINTIILSDLWERAPIVDIRKFAPTGAAAPG